MNWNSHHLGACPTSRDLESFNLGSLPLAAIESIGDHLRNCQACVSFLDTLNRSVEFDLAGCVEDRQHQPLGQLLDEAEFQEMEAKAKSMIVDGSVSTSTIEQVPAGADQQPDKIGDYLVIREIGRGGFACVYLARDPYNKRLVAIKVPREDRRISESSLQGFLAEARTVADLDHPKIVPVYDWGRIGSDNCFVVMKYVEGQSLQDAITSQCLNRNFAVRVVAEIAEALHHAHKHGIIHRDIKPANVLLDVDGTSYVSDFGLAIQNEHRWAHRGERAGTHPYMAPEQIRSESHRLDGRTDVWSLGVVLYEMLARQRPFRGASNEQLDDEIQFRDPVPPRQIDETISTELERICLRCLCKRMADRYTTAFDLAVDLRGFLSDSQVNEHAKSDGAFSATADSIMTLENSSLQVIPKGLRCFDQNDSDFFLALLPGPRDRHQMPDSIRFWKTRIEERVPDTTFAVGVMYGPSGCGKTSFIRAGLLPRISRHVISVYVEASGKSLDAKILNNLRKRIPDMPRNLGFHDSLAALRQGTCISSSEKVLIVIDQFEQWLHSVDPNEYAALVAGLRQCEGDRIQCLILVRDEFWLAVSRFARDVEIQLVEGKNTLLIDLLDVDHALKVLTAFGRALGRLPSGDAPLSVEQTQFVEQAANAMADRIKVNSVRLALFVEMMKEQSWVTSNLRQIGGLEGVGVAFLDATFVNETASPEHRVHQKAAQAVLSALLPPPNVDIRGHRRSYQELHAASGHLRAKEFDRLIEILDSETRLITPIDDVAENDELADGEVGSPDRYFQLTHDYLVPSLRVWLTRKQRETRRGRAELILAERAMMWTSRKEEKQLPSFLETLTIWAFTNRSSWHEYERRTVNAATRFYTRRIAILASTLAALTAILLALAQYSISTRHKESADRLVDGLMAADLERVGDVLILMEPEREWWLNRVRRIAADSNGKSADRVRAHMALVSKDVSSVDYLVYAVRHSDHVSIPHIRRSFEAWPSEATNKLWTVIEALPYEDAGILPVASCLASFDATSTRWTLVADKTASALVGASSFAVGEWTRALLPVAPALLDPVTKRFKDAQMPSPRRLLAAEILARFAADSPDTLCDLIVDAEGDQFPVIFSAIQSHPMHAARQLPKFLAGTGRDAAPNTLAQRTRAANALILLGYGSEVWPLLHSKSSPDLRTLLLESFRRFNIPMHVLSRELSEEHPPSIRSAILLAHGEYSWNEVDATTVTEVVRHLYTSDPNACVHSSAEWLLRAWQQPIPEIPHRYNLADPSQDWWVNSEGQTMIIFKGPVEYQMGSAEAEPGRDPIELLHRERIDHSFAVSAHEVTIEQYLHFAPSFAFARDIGNTNTCPINKATWFDAIRYCRWLSEREGIPEHQMCYPPIARINEMENNTTEDGQFNIDKWLPGDLIARSGYRLPTEVEWEYAARGATYSRWCFGNDESRLPRFAWYMFNADEHSWPVGTLQPNLFGIFDVHGNLQEWCQSRSGDVPSSDEIATALGSGADVRPRERIVRGGHYRGMTKLTRSAKRYSYPPKTRVSILGFRIVKTISEQPTY